jgi:hypothetical protein
MLLLRSLQPIQTTNIGTESIKVQDLKIGETINLGWVPEYYMKVEYKGDFLFEVKKCFGHFKKKKGDTFRAKKIHSVKF